MDAQNIKNQSTCEATELRRHHERLVGLQISLQQAYHSGEIARELYEPRLKYIENQLHIVNELQSWNQAEKDQLTTEHNLGLPDLDVCSPEELLLILSHLNERKELIESLIKTSSMTLDWVEYASHSNKNSLRFNFQLSKLKKFLGQIQQETTKISLDEDEVNHVMIKLGRTLVESKKSMSVLENLEAVTRIFSRIERITSRINQLRERFSSEKKVISQMCSWLSSNNPSKNSDTKNNSKPLPANHSLATAYEQAFDKSNLDAMDECRQRLTLSRNYLEKYLESKNLETSRPKSMTSNLRSPNFNKRQNRRKDRRNLV